MLVVGAQMLPAPAASGAPKSRDALDEELLKDLDDDAGTADKDRAEKKQADDPSADDLLQPPAKKDTAKKDDEGLDDELMRDLDAGGDEAGQDRSTPLMQVSAQKMRQVERLMSKTDSSQPTQKLQKEIIHELDELMAAARRRQNQPSGGSSSSQGSRRDRIVTQPQQSTSEQTAARDSERPARDSSPRQVDREPHKPDMAKMNDLLRELWGHLPERERQRVINSTVEKFVPKYELLIEEYFKRLADSARDERPLMPTVALHARRAAK